MNFTTPTVDILVAVSLHFKVCEKIKAFNKTTFSIEKCTPGANHQKAGDKNPTVPIIYETESQIKAYFNWIVT